MNRPLIRGLVLSSALLPAAMPARGVDPAGLRGGSGAAPAVQAPAVETLMWMAGCWGRESGTAFTEEIWTRPRGGMMVGLSRTVRDGTAVAFEHLLIFERGDSVIYRASPSGQATTEFSAAVLSDTLAVFENPGHDFPQRILYRPAPGDSLHARIEGPGVDGGTRGADFRYGRTACPGAPRADPVPFSPSESLISADRAFARDSRARGADAWADAWADDGRLGDAPDSIAVGRDAVRRWIGPTLDRYGARFRWEPTESGMLWPDSLGYTVGRWWLESEPAGAREDSGRYVTVWQRQGGSWKVALDMSLPAPRLPGVAGDFDFWIGDWEVDQRIWTGSGDDSLAFPARSRVRSLDGGSAVVESWEGDVLFPWTGMEAPARVRGASLRVRSPETGRWRIFWIDTLDRRFGPPFEGAFDDAGVGTFVRTSPLEGGGRPRIRFRPRPDDTVLWDLSLVGGPADGRLLWAMEFRTPRSAGSPRR
jgi:ketosteroid isomerase-like protein